MRIVLLYPPPWKIPEPGQPVDPSGEGPPAEHREGDLDGDFWQIPHGLLSLAAAAREAGHRVKVLNLSAWSWAQVEKTVRALSADLFGLSCFTANRRGVGALSALLRKTHPNAHVVVGGPHVTALPTETLAHWPSVDAVVVGEGEQTFLELVDRLVAGRSLRGLAGAAVRLDGRPTLGPARARVKELDALPSPHRHFATHVMLTARGCPGQCTFCATGAVWGRRYRAHSVARVLDDIEHALSKLPVAMLSFKDETFTADRRRGLALCEGIVERGLRFVWSCDTRADSLDERLVRAMRLAGCERLSLGVESGSPEVLRAIRKRVTPTQILETTRLARRYGLRVRYFMMIGNRGETVATLRESVDFVRRAGPHEAIFACLSIYPGTEDYRDLVAEGVLDADVYFEEDFLELKMPFDSSAEDEAALSEWFEHHRGLLRIEPSGITELEGALERLGEHAGAHLELARAHYAAHPAAGALARAREHANRALELGYPLPGLVHNVLACIAAREGDGEVARESIRRGLAVDGRHACLIHNAERVGRWLERDGGAPRSAPELALGGDFELLERTEQPTLPGPLPAGFLRWD